MMLAFALSAAVALSLSTAEAKDDTDIYAVVVGHNGGTRSLPALQYADDDALRAARFFTAFAAPEQVTVLTTLDAQTRAELPSFGDAGRLPLRPPTRAELLGALAALAEKLASRPPGRRAWVFFSFAGHGLQGRFLLQPERGEEASMTGAELEAALARLRADRLVLFFDACRSQSLFSDRGFDFDDEIRELERAAGSERLGVITAARTQGSAAELPSLRAGYFSHVLFSGLAGAADADDDGVVTYAELAGFVAFNTQHFTRQPPWFRPPRGQVDAPVLELSRGRARLRLPAALSGRLSLETAEGRLVVELHKSAQRPLWLVQPPGGYVLRREPSQALALRLAPGENELPAESAWGVPAPAPTGRGTDFAGFEAPFTPAVVDALTTGFAAGRSPEEDVEPPNELSVGYAVGPAPLSQQAVEMGAALAYLRRWQAFQLGARAELSSASAGTGRALTRTGLYALAGAPLRLHARVTLAPYVGIGLRMVFLATEAAPLQADLTAPSGLVSLRASVRLAAEWLAFVEARGALDLVAVDAARSPSLSGGVVLGAALRF